MAGRWMTRQSEVILADLEREGDFWPWMLEEVSNGKTPKKLLAEVQQTYALTWGALWRWINKDETRVRQWAEAAVGLSWWHEFERIDIADGATPETVAVAKLQSETRHSVAGSLNPGVFGRDKGSTGGGGITVNLIQFNEAEVLAGAPSRVIESTVPARLPVVHEQETTAA